MYKSHTLQRLATTYGWVISFGSNLQSLFLLWMRLTWGHQFFMIGSDKLSNIEKTTQFFTTLNISHPEFHAYLVGYTELIGGALLIVGFLSRLISIPLACIMITALSTAHRLALSDFRFITDPSTLVRETPYPFLITALLVLAFGPGRVSIDALLKRWANRQPQL